MSDINSRQRTSSATTKSYRSVDSSCSATDSSYVQMTCRMLAPLLLLLLLLCETARVDCLFE